MRLHSHTILPWCFFALIGQTRAADIATIEATHGIPDYSYAGYHRSERALPRIEGPVFNIVDFGAVPDDGKSDRAAIQRAVEAASKQGGGVVFVPKGRFDLTEPGDAASLRIASSRIVLRGVGSGEGGSVLFQREALAPPPPMRLWASPSAIEIGGSGERHRIGRIVRDVERGALEVEVENGGTLKAGDWIILSLLDNRREFVASELSGLQVIHPSWTSIIEKGVSSAERHQIAAVRGRTLVLTAPVIKPVRHRDNWHVDTWVPLEEIGVENLRFEGAWHERFVHHRSWMDDGGFSLLKLRNVANSWIRDCIFANVNRAAGISGSAQVTVLDSAVEGTPGHNAINFLESSFCLMARVEDRASQWHSLGVSNESIGNVLWRCYWNSDTCFESHSSQPRHTLIDTCFGGFMKGRGGGARVNLPTHLEGLIMWNHLKTNPALEDFQFEPLDEIYWRVVQPLIVGMHGTPITFRAGQSTVLSPGTPLAEGSLYEFQLRRRLGALPDDLKSDAPAR